MSTFNVEMFLRLLAGENMKVITSAKFSTAWCDPNSRTIGIPKYSSDSKAIQILFAGHEVGHAIFTPKFGSHDEIEKQLKHNQLLMHCLNVTEDIRQERLIKNRYVGLNRWFQIGYDELVKKGFFGDLNDPAYVEKLNIADKVNILAKLGRACPLKLTQFEISVFRYVRAISTFDEAKDRAVYLYELVKKENKESQTQKSAGKGSGKGEPGDGADGEIGDLSTMPGDSAMAPDSLSPGEIQKLKEMAKKSFEEAMKESSSEGLNTSKKSDAMKESMRSKENSNGSSSIVAVPKMVKIKKIA